MTPSVRQAVVTSILQQDLVEVIMDIIPTDHTELMHDPVEECELSRFLMQEEQDQ